MARKCPNCGELVPDFSVTCPKCYKEIPRKEVIEESIPKDESSTKQKFNKWIVLILAIVPALFGFMGLAQIYQRKFKRGAAFLVVGLALFWILVGSVMLIKNGEVGWVIFGVGCIIIFGLMFLATFVVQLLDAFARVVFRFL